MNDGFGSHREQVKGGKVVKGAQKPDHATTWTIKVICLHYLGKQTARESLHFYGRHFTLVLVKSWIDAKDLVKL